MNAEIKWLDDPKVFRVNQIPAHSDHEFYHTWEEYNAGKSSMVRLLNGKWKFWYSENANERPVNFYQPDFDSSYFQEMNVPGHIELAGYDKIHYINTMYPWEGHAYRRPAYCYDGENKEEGTFSEAVYNPVGSYLYMFDLDEDIENKQVRVCFEGAEQAVYVWLNGKFLGYAEDSFTPSEFDLTQWIKRKNNVLAVEVHKRSTAAFLEDQDFFRFFGIFRDVKLYILPEIHLEDIWLRTQYNPETGRGILETDMKMKGGEKGGKIIVTVKKGDLILVEKELSVNENLNNQEIMEGEVIPWDMESPFLYDVFLEIYDSKDILVELVPYKIGFRKIEIKDKVIYLNGKRLIINGINRHEWSAETGRTISREEELWDIEFLKKNHINAVRTCHYPDRISWYYLCDLHGVCVMAETNLESHGSFQKMGEIEPSWNVPGKIGQWQEMVIDRARSNFELLKNHTSILFWSLGNESYAEEGMCQMNRFYKSKDSTRLVHYEGVFHNRVFEEKISDVESRMYASPEDIREYLEANPKKPVILCEFMHSMGNSVGGLKEYMVLLEQYEMYQGGFIWDYIDQALWVEDPVTHRRVLRYGGDFDDRPSDYGFSGNGILFADRTEKPAVQEVRYFYAQYRM